MRVDPGRLVAAAPVVAALMVAACDQRNDYVAPPPPKVTVMTPTKQPVTRYYETTGNTAAVMDGDIDDFIEAEIRWLRTQGL